MKPGEMHTHKTRTQGTVSKDMWKQHQLYLGVSVILKVTWHDNAVVLHVPMFPPHSPLYFLSSLFMEPKATILTTVCGHHRLRACLAPPAHCKDTLVPAHLVFRLVCGCQDSVFRHYCLCGNHVTHRTISQSDFRECFLINVSPNFFQNPLLLN